MTPHLALALALGQYDIDPLLEDEQADYADYAARSALLATWDQASEASWPSPGARRPTGGDA